MSSDLERSGEPIEYIKRRYAQKYLVLPGVSSFGVEKDETGEYVITIHVNPDHPSIREELPDNIEGYNVLVRESGPFQAITM